jgi:hypothetical protein
VHDVAPLCDALTVTAAVESHGDER